MVAIMTNKVHNLRIAYPEDTLDSEVVQVFYKDRFRLLSSCDEDDRSNRICSYRHPNILGEEHYYLR